MSFLTITAIDHKSTSTTSRTFNADSNNLKKQIEEWQTEITYRRFHLTTEEIVSDYPAEVQTILDELEVEY